MVRLFYKIIFVGFLFSIYDSGAVKADTLPNVTAKAWLVADDSGKVINGVNTQELRSIASITKLVTAMVVLDANQPLDEILTLRKNPVTRLELINLTIAHSDNAAARLLCTSYVDGYDSCIEAMNKKVKELGMKNTSFVEPTGLSVLNVSTAEELITLVDAASKYPEIVEASNIRVVKVKVNGKKKTFWQEFRNTNPWAGRGVNYLISKTGFISKSGGCIVLKFNTESGVKTVVLLGSKNTKTRIPEAHLLASLY